MLKSSFEFITFLKSMSCVTKVPSDLWNSRVIISSVTFADIVSKSMSPPCAGKNRIDNDYHQDHWNLHGIKVFCPFVMTEKTTNFHDELTILIFSNCDKRQSRNVEFEARNLGYPRVRDTTAKNEMLDVPDSWHLWANASYKFRRDVAKRWKSRTTRWFSSLRKKLVYHVYPREGN